MKKKVVYFLMVAVLFGTVYSCAKTNKRKLSNDWKVESMSMKTDWDSKYYNPETYQYEGQGNDTETVSGSTVVFSWSSSSTSSTWDWLSNEWGTANTNNNEGSETGVVNTYTFNIEKDGTWKMSSDFTFSETSDYSENLKRDQSGTWDFLGKSDDFKKNERVVFNILSSTVVYTENDEGKLYSNTNSSNYTQGENTMIYTVDESSKKELELSYDAKTENTSSTSDDTNFIDKNSTVTVIKIKMTPAE